MQKLNAREYFVVVLISIMTIAFLVTVFNEFFSDTSPFVTTASGEISITRNYMINIGQNLLRLVLGLVAVIFLLKGRRAGWIAAFTLLVFFVFIAFYLLSSPLFGGKFDGEMILSLSICLALLLALIFLCIPSTLKKFNITKTAIIPVVILLGLMVAVHFFIPTS